MNTCLQVNIKIRLRLADITTHLLAESELEKVIIKTMVADAPWLDGVCTNLDKNTMPDTCCWKKE